jgi:hypothetical protein
MTRRKTAAATALTAQPEPANDAEVIAPSNGRVVGGTALPEPAGYAADGSDVEDAFPDEEAESVESLRPVLATPATQPDELAPALVEPAEPFAHRAGPAAPRRITVELVKAETQLVRLERRRQESFAHAETVWAQKRAALIKSFPRDVLAALLAMNVLEGDDVEESED